MLTREKIVLIALSAGAMESRRDGKTLPFAFDNAQQLEQFARALIAAHEFDGAPAPTPFITNLHEDQQGS